jgi:hypothetical protein
MRDGAAVEACGELTRIRIDIVDVANVPVIDVLVVVVLDLCVVRAGPPLGFEVRRGFPS